MLDVHSALDFRRLFETLPGLYVVVQPDFTVIAVTDEYLRATHVRREEIIGLNLFDVFPENPADGDARSSANVRASLEKVFQTGKPDVLPIQKYDIQRTAKEGGGYEERYWRLVTFPNFDAADKIPHVTHRVEDITEQVNLQQAGIKQDKLNAELKVQAMRIESERQQAEAALKDARFRLGAALEAGEIGTWTWDVINNRIVADENLARFFSVSREDAEGGQIEKYTASIHADDRERVENLIADALENADSYEAEYRLVNPDGSIRWVVARGRVLRNENETAFQLPGVVIDITGRKQAEEALRESQTRLAIALQAGRAGSFEWDVKRNISIWSPELEELYGVPAGTFEKNIEAWTKRVVAEDMEFITRDVRAAMNNGVQDYEYEFRAILPDNSHRWFAGRARFEYDSDNKPSRMLGINIDITDRKLIESEREQLLWSEKAARAEAENANRLKDDFLATLSHELRTPLSAILGWSRMLREQKLTEEQAARALETIERNARSQSQLIEDILDVSRIISGKLRLEVRPVELNSIIEMAIEAVRPAAEAKGIRLQRITDTGVMISGDADRLQQIVWNLLSNAIKFTPKQGRVQIKLERINSHVEIIVADDGIGINAETLPFIFERFRQSDSSTTRQHGGLGLGLAIVRHLVELHGGTVQAASEGLEKGSVFTVTFPLIALRSKAIPASDEKTRERVHPTHNSEVPFICPDEIENLRVLLVDDEPDTRSLLVFILDNCKARPTGVASVAEALGALENSEFDILVSDIGMPERDGYDLIENVRKLSPERGGRIPAVALTAYARVEDRMRVLSAGFQMHVPKPVEPAELLAVLASLARRNNGK